MKQARAKALSQPETRSAKFARAAYSVTLPPPALIAVTFRSNTQGSMSSAASTIPPNGDSDCVGDFLERKLEHFPPKWKALYSTMLPMLGAV